MSFVCSVSGQPALHPVVEKATGKIFEARIWKSMDKSEEEGVFITDVVPTTAPRTPEQTSIPTILQSLQNEWDACMIQQYELKMQNHKLQQQVASALYQQDAACRVIARITKERDEARAALANIGSTINTTEQSKMDVDQPETTSQLPLEIITAIDNTANELVKTRRKRKAPAELTKAESIRTFKTTTDLPSPHLKSNPLISCFSQSRKDSNIIATGGPDKHINIVSLSDGKVIKSISGKGAHTKPITDLNYHPTQELLISSSADKTIKLWSASYEAETLKSHSAEVTAISIHPSGDYLMSASENGSWALHDIANVKTVVNVDGQGAIKCLQVHPDGALMATAGAEVSIWDIKKCEVVAEFTGHSDTVRSLAFSENGYILATVDGANTVKIWDLRKLSAVKTFELPNTVNHLSFDHSGSYLGVGGTGISVFDTKQWEEITVIGSDVCSKFGWTDHYASGIVSVGDHVKIWEN